MVIPKVTLRDMSQVNEMFGPVQAAVAKAVADLVEENAFAGIDIEDTVILVSAFVHPDAKDYNRIYRFNYGATKLCDPPGRWRSSPTPRPSCTRRTVQRTASWASRCSASGTHRTCRWPWISWTWARWPKSYKKIPENDHVIIQAGTPLIKKFGLSVIGEIRKLRPNAFIIADMKILEHREPRGPHGSRCNR